MGLSLTLKRIVEQKAVLTREESRALMAEILTGDFTEITLAGLLTALATRGETAAEIAGFAEAMRLAALQLPLNAGEREMLVDTCGSGGDLSGTFNISTAAALVATAAGASVAKHGNRSVTSMCGSADVLEALGIPISQTPEAGAETLRRNSFLFLHAPELHPGMKAVMPVRRALGVRTVFNILGPMANPAGAPSQVMGVYAPHLVPVVAEAMAMLNTRHAFIVHGNGLDEITLDGATQIAEVKGRVVSLMTLKPEDLGLKSAPISEIRGGDAVENAAILTAIFAGQQGPRRDVVVLNAAAVLVVAGKAATLKEGVALAQSTIDCGAVTALLEKLRS
ncbi:anthranilate phosphoribosyltransferase [Terriglobus sp. 2YAB30_2]|uniref:anthranilate phosphoribosyltransferase n=1 Tax=unclassified Terriglobus TaxID=2628988 RepID=UPI003F99A776